MVTRRPRTMRRALVTFSRTDYPLLVDSPSKISSIIKSLEGSYVLETQDARRNRPARVRSIREIIMKKTILTAIGAMVLVASTMQVASAAEHRHVRKTDRAPISEQFRNANNAMVLPAPGSAYSDYSEGHVISAPAGR